MLSLSIVAPNKQKVEFQCEAATTFGEVKAKVEASLGVPRDKQRLLCNGKERKDNSESLSTAGLSGKTKIMLMLVPGYTMPAADIQLDQVPAPMEEAPETAVDVEGELPAADVEASAEASTEASEEASEEGTEAGCPAWVIVRQGRNRYRVRVPMGLHRASYRELAEYLSARLLPPGIPPGELRFLSKGKTAAASDPLGPVGSGDISVMLLFREGFHTAVDGANWLNERTTELKEAELEIERLAKRVAANFADGGETSIRLAEIGALLDTLTQSVDSVRVSEAKLPQLRELRDRALRAAESLERARRAVRL